MQTSLYTDLNNMLNTLSSALNVSESQFNFILQNFEIGKYFLLNDDINNENKFYFLNGNDFISCTNDVTWIFFNQIVQINNATNTNLLNVFVNYSASVSNLLDLYDYTPNQNETLFRNFFINENYQKFENLILTFNPNEAAYLKVIAKFAFIVLIILLYD